MYGALDVPRQTAGAVPCEVCGAAIGIGLGNPRHGTGGDPYSCPMTSADMSEKVRDVMYVERPAGTRLARSRASEGNRGLLLNDANELVGHVELFPADQDDSRIMERAVCVALGFVACYATMKAAPYVKSGLSGLRSKLNRTPQGTASDEAPVLDARITRERIDGSPARTAAGPVRTGPGLGEDLIALADTAVPEEG